MARVYISNYNDEHDYTKAERFGRVVPVTTGNVNIYRPQRTLVTMCENIKGITEDDYILFSGNALSGLLIAVACMHKVRVLNLLVFNARDSDYIHHRVDLEATRFLPIDELINY
jgi:hypothetical protein